VRSVFGVISTAPPRLSRQSPFGACPSLVQLEIALLQTHKSLRSL
jgi:hypothetical protein